MVQNKTTQTATETKVRAGMVALLTGTMLAVSIAVGAILTFFAIR